MANEHRPTDAELAILNELWRLGRAPVRQVFNALVARGSRVGYTTVLKLMQIMTEKGLLRREDAGRTHVYRSAYPESRIRRQLVSDLIRRAFDNSAAQMVLHALSAKPVSREELKTIREAIEKFEKEAE